MSGTTIRCVIVASNVVSRAFHIQLNQREKRESRKSLPYEMYLGLFHILTITRNTYLSSLEDRLRRMEEAIKKPSSSPSPSRRMSGELRHQSIPDQMSALKINDDGTSIFVGKLNHSFGSAAELNLLGSASTFSIISPLGMKWIADITGNDDFERVVARIPNLSEIGASDPKVWSHLKDEDREPLPSIRRAIAHFDCELDQPP